MSQIGQHRWLVVGMLLLIGGASASAWLGNQAQPVPDDGAKQPPPVDFTVEIWPILESRCFGCHGPQKQRGGLRLDQKDTALEGGESGQVIVPGNSAASPLVKRITSQDKKEHMPPTG